MDKLSGSEAIFGFVGWLISQEEETVLGRHHDCSPITELIKEFCDANNLEEPRDHWHDNLIHPLIFPQRKKEAAYCDQKGCEKTATHRMFWPGSAKGPILCCAPHADRGVAVGDAMGCSIRVEKL